MRGVDDPQRDFLRFVEGGELLREAAALVRPAGIVLMPLKGVWLQRAAYDPPQSRRIVDVDVLAPAGRFDEARALLVGGGFRATAGNRAETALTHPRFSLDLDLHRDLFGRGSFDMPTADLFERGRLDDGLFGFEVHLPDPRDAFAHLCGHLVKSRGLAAARHAEDFVRLMALPELSPAGVAAHLARVGMARAARVALRDAARHDSAVAAVLAALPADAVGRGLAAVAGRLQASLPATSTLRAVPSYLVDRSLPAGARALALRLWDRRQDF